MLFLDTSSYFRFKSKDKLAGKDTFLLICIKLCQDDENKFSENDFYLNISSIA